MRWSLSSCGYLDIFYTSRTSKLGQMRSDQWSWLTVAVISGLRSPPLLPCCIATSALLSQYIHTAPHLLTGIVMECVQGF